MANAHNSNFRQALVDDLRRVCDLHGAPLDKAFNRVAARWLGYNLDTEHFVDGAGDNGLDFWFQTDMGFDLFQAKTHEWNESGELDWAVFDGEGVSDLSRLKNFLLSDAPEVRKESLKAFWHRWEHAIESRRGLADAEALTVNLGLVVLGEGLTSAAEEQLRQFRNSLEGGCKFGGVEIGFTAALYTVQDLIERRWREDNRLWKDITGKSKNFAELRPEGVEEALIKNNTAVFYCRCIDLVNAYREFGYQLFEPNVRCNITMSKVNAAIRESILSRATREEFRFLNNGVTIVCKSYTKPSINKPAFKVIEPGVVNGLQTVFALFEASQKLESNEKEHFEKNCFVLVRLLQEHSVRDISRMVRATNTQNPMQARNLASNNSEQVEFEKLFAELGWFYERKQGAWEAYATDSRRWRTLPGKNRDSFQHVSGAGRPRIRRVDNEALAQCWLSFCGACEEANHAKRLIFENESWYDFVFLHSPRRHGADYGYIFEQLRDNAIDEAPIPAFMLASYFAREIARTVVPTQRENREAAMNRLGLGPKTKKEEVDERLAKDSEYLLWQVASGMSFLFAEFFGLVIMRSIGHNLRQSVSALTRNGLIASLHREPDFQAAAVKIRSVETEKNDVLAISWGAFTHCLEELVSSSWIDEYQQSRSRNRFNYSKETRQRLHKALQSLHAYTERRELTRPWAVGLSPTEGLFGFVRQTLSEPRTRASTA
jgi:AIPR protein